MTKPSRSRHIDNALESGNSPEKVEEKAPAKMTSDESEMQAVGECAVSVSTFSNPENNATHETNTACTELYPSTEKFTLEKPPVNETSDINNNVSTEVQPTLDEKAKVELEKLTVTVNGPSGDIHKHDETMFRKDARSTCYNERSLTEGQEVECNGVKFRVLHAKNNCELKEFVTSNSHLTFKRGCTYYEFTHEKETISGKQQIILFNKVSTWNTY